MAIIKCKMCGGDLELVEGQSVAECEFCGTTQTVPNADSEKMLSLFSRANKLRAACDFDKAAGVYESIVAEFPEEAEAFWGLVLCKYGIEYVDDPGTGKKIPTCHRSSFDSVMDDSNYDQALENADMTARRVYREEAKAIEELRKSIIEASSTEEPYDIFICYKETDPNGERTLDSVRGQEIYDALTDKGYRVFFARITLEDKLGAEYEPCIFAALNSAKIMLAIGTDYEYYNAVWVKNEWSRFLKLMEKDKSKHLIPCYEGITAYDMPKEFARLQAQDLGKLGAIQDLSRGIEKLLPKKEAPVVMEVSRGLSPNLESLMKRAYIFLEDKDWTSADKYFDDILDIEPECAEAYLGKCLVQHKCSTAEELSNARIHANFNAKSQTAYAKVHMDERETQIVQQYALPGYLEKKTLSALFNFNDSYSSTLSDRVRQLQAEKNWFSQDRNMSRAMRYASGDFKTKVEHLREGILESLEGRVSAAEKVDAKNAQRLKDAYEQQLAGGEAKAKQLYEEAVARREEDYMKYMQAAESAIEADRTSLLETAKKDLQKLGGFKDCAAMVDTLQEKLDAIAEAEEAERQRIAREKEEERRRIAREKEEARRRKEEEERYRREVESAYYAEYPIAKTKDGAENRVKEIRERLAEIEKSLKKKAGRVVCWIFFLLGVVEFIIGLDGDESLLAIGAICGGLFGIVLMVIANNRKKLRKERRALGKEEAELKDSIGKISQLPTIEEYTRIYGMRQTEEGKKLLEEEERQRQLELRQQKELEKRARKKRIIKKCISTAVTLLVLAAIAVGIWYINAHLIPGNRVNQAQAAIDAKDYQTAYDLLNGYAPYGDSEKLLEQAKQSGKYITTKVVINSTNSYSDLIYTYEYDDQGRVQYILVYDTDNPSADAQPVASNLERVSALEYTFYKSGNLKTVTIINAKTGKPIQKMEFYDKETSCVTSTLGNPSRTSAEANVTRDLLRFEGVKMVTHYGNDGKTAATKYGEHGFEATHQVTLDSEGRVSEVVNGKYVKTYTYNKDGSLKQTDDDGDVFLYSYKKDLNGQLLEYSYQEDWRDVQEHLERYTYDEHNQLSSVRIEKREDASYGDDYLGWYYTAYIENQWLDYAKAAKEDQESVGLGVLQGGQLNAAMERSFLEALELLEGMKPTGEAAALAKTLKTYAPYCGTFCEEGNTARTMESDFFLQNGEIYWKCQRDVKFIGVILNDWEYSFFQEPTVVEDMTVYEEYFHEEYRTVVDATITFESDGSITYMLGYWAELELNSSGKVVAKYDHTQIDDIMRIIPLEQAAAAETVPAE